MNDLQSVLGDEGERAEDVQAERPGQTEQAQTTGEEAATPAEKPEPQQDTARGLQAGIVAERQRRQAVEAEAAAMREELQRLRNQPQAQQAGADRPNPANFTDTETYLEALADYKAGERLNAEFARRDQEATARRDEEAARQKHTALQTAMDSAVTAGRAEFADFDEVINSGLAPHLNPVLHQALVSTPGGHKVAHYLGKNPAEAARISQLEPMAMLIELGALRASATATAKPVIPQTLTHTRDARGQFAQAAGYDGPTPLDAVLRRKV